MSVPPANPVVDVANCLIAMGAKIEGAGSPRIIVKGVKKLRGVDWTVIPDRIETATFLLAAAITGGEYKSTAAAQITC